MQTHLSYRDVLLLYDDEPVRIMSRKDPDITSELCPGKELKIPLVASPMDSISSFEMSLALAEAGATSIITRYINNNSEITLQKEIVEKLKKNNVSTVAVAIGVKEENHSNPYDHALMMCDAGANVICVDVANGNHILVARAIEQVQKLKEWFHDLSIIAGNIATGKAARRLASWGVNGIKVGTGSGACCTTRRVLGFGCPQFSAVLDCASALKKDYPQVKVIADGGIRSSADAVKALFAGADSVMCGWIFAGHKECPVINNERIYRGMASRYVNGRKDVASEGVQVKINQKDSVKDVVREYGNAIQAACAFANARNLQELRRNARFIRVSTLTIDESDPVNEIV